MRDSLRHYSRSPYAGYADSEQIMFAVGAIDRRFHPKEFPAVIS
ncbi:MAG: DUF3179 domain-containing protein [Ectothiorhodospiraceae bacterium]|nr:DUF3179 domain-containing protein [Ectothiorhodospiraceae bacterium]